MLRISALISTIIVVSASPIAAQSVSALQSGARVRIDVAGKGSFRGLLLEPPGDSVRVSTLSGARAVARTEVKRVRVSRGREGRGVSMLRNGGWGALIGLVGGVVLGFADGDDDSRDWFAMSASEKAAVGGLFFSGVGLVTGSLVGLGTPGERWENVTLR